tara:strand:+ start:934 stop:1164 length:231 start_codon:yes stop_codon:yes gene_type:complete
MGWSRGSEILQQVWKAQRGYIQTRCRQRAFERIAEVFWDNDCDTLEELICDEWPEIKAALEKIGYLEEEEEDEEID